MKTLRPAVPTAQGAAADAINEPTGRIAIVDSLRGIAALAVAWYHFTNGGHLLTAGVLKSSGEFGWLGVEVFFVISGFIIPYSMFRSGYQLRSNGSTFILKRVIRLDPPYLLAIVMTIALAYASAAVPAFRGSEPAFTGLQILSHFGYLTGSLGYS